MTYAVEADNLSVCYGEFTVLEDISFKIPTGSFTAVVGPNGSGKSTLLRVLTGSVIPESGRITLFENPPNKVKSDWIGYVPQIKSFSRNFPGRAVEFVVSGIRHSWPFRIKPQETEMALEALRNVGAEKLAKKQLSSLSGGELQRIYLARCMIHKPRLLLLDEPMTGIDAAGEADIYRILDKLHGETSILMVTHDLQTALHHSSHVIVMNRKLIGFGKPEECLTGECLEIAFGHAGHSHPKLKGVGNG